MFRNPETNDIIRQRRVDLLTERIQGGDYQDPSEGAASTIVDRALLRKRIEKEIEQQEESNYTADLPYGIEQAPGSRDALTYLGLAIVSASALVGFVGGFLACWLGLRR